RRRKADRIQRGRRDSRRSNALVQLQANHQQRGRSRNWFARDASGVLNSLGALSDEDHDGAREQPESATDAHDAVLGWSPAAEELGESHHHSKQSSQKEEPGQDQQK